MSETQERSARLGQRIRRALGQPPPLADDEPRRRFVAAALGEGSWAGTRLPWRWATAVGVLCVVAPSAWWLASRRATGPEAGREDRSASLRVTALAGEGALGPIGEGAWLHSEGKTPLQLRFEGGTLVELEPGSRGTLMRARRGQVELFLTQGTLRADVRAAKGATWSVAAGPYRVTVLGTRFSVRWTPGDGRLWVEVERGRVEVSGRKGRRVTLVEGQRLRAEAEAGRIHIDDRMSAPGAVAQGLGSGGSSFYLPGSGAGPWRDLAAPWELSPPGKAVGTHGAGADTRFERSGGERSGGEGPGGEGPGGEDSSGEGAGGRVARGAPGGPAPRVGPASTANSPVGTADASVREGGGAPRADPLAGSKTAHWPRLAEAGRYKDILLEARALGLPTLLRTLPKPELSILAEACRYQGDTGLAVAALIALRERYAGSSQARRAVYLLGRVHAESLGQQGEACGWFSRYLAESPKGELVEEALGRMMDSCAKGGLRDSARLAAKLYLARYPAGVFRELALSLSRQAGAQSQSRPQPQPRSRPGPRPEPEPRPEPRSEPRPPSQPPEREIPPL